MVNYLRIFLISTLICISMGCGSSDGGGGGGSIPADVYLVDPTADGTDGKTWPTAFHSIQEAVNAASADGGGSVWVASGIYTSPMPLLSVIEMASGVDVFGGFEGFAAGIGAKETALAARDISANITILDGNNGSYQVVDAADDCLLDGFTVIRGKCDTASTDDRFGGGIRIIGLTGVTISNCTLTGNIAGSGGGIAVYNLAEAVIKDCTFIANTSDVGGGLYIGSATAEVTDCTFIGNTANSGGGGLAVFSTSTVTVTGCMFQTNTAPSVNGGGAVNYLGGDAVYTDCIFNGNSAGLGGGAYNNQASPEFTGCLFSGNDAPGSGAGLLMDTCTYPIVKNCVFENGVVINGYGGGIFFTDSGGLVTGSTFRTNWVAGGANPCGGGIGLWNGSDPVITDCMFIKNYAENQGGGLHSQSSLAHTVYNCTFIGNRTLGDGGGVCGNSVDMGVVNCVFYGNVSDRGGGLFFNNNTGTVLNSTFTRNHSNYGGAVGNYLNTAGIANCISEANYASTSPEIYNDTSSTDIYYSIIEGSYPGSVWDPLLGADGGGNTDSAALFTHVPEDFLWIASIDSSTQFTVSGSAPAFCSPGDTIEIGHDGIPRTVETSAGSTVTFTPAMSSYNTELDRMVLNWGSGETDVTEDLTLGTGSAAIDAGSNTLVPADSADLDEDLDTAEKLPVDRIGNDRIQDDPDTADTGSGTAPIVDMGAFEY